MTISYLNQEVRIGIRQFTILTLVLLSLFFTLLFFLRSQGEIQFTPKEIPCNTYAEKSYKICQELSLEAQDLTCNTETLAKIAQILCNEDGSCTCQF